MQSADKSKSKRTLALEKRSKIWALRRFYRELPLHPSLKFTISMVFFRTLTLVKGIMAGPVPTAGRPNARSRKEKYKILVIGLVTPRPDRDAGSVRTVNFFRYLIDLGADITFIPEQDLAYVAKHTPALERLGVRCLYFPKIWSVRNFIRKHMGEYDIVVLERIAVADRYQKIIRQNAHYVPIIFDTQDLHHLRVARQAELSGSNRQRREADRLKTMEYGAIRRADVTFVVSQYEQELIRAVAPDTAVEVIPLLVEPSPLDEAFDHRQGILFLGGFHHPPNADAVLHFAQHVWPIIENALPQSAFYVIGSDPPPEIQALQSDRIEIMGFVENLEPILARCRISVAPLRFGAGVKGKIATSLSYGLPCVASPLAIEGSGLTPEQDILLAEDDEQFARQVIRLHEDKALWDRLSKNGVAFVAENYSADAVRPKLQDLLDRLMKQKAARISA